MLSAAMLEKMEGQETLIARSDVPLFFFLMKDCVITVKSVTLRQVWWLILVQAFNCLKGYSYVLYSIVRSRQNYNTKEQHKNDLTLITRVINDKAFFCYCFCLILESSETFIVSLMSAMSLVHYWSFEAFIMSDTMLPFTERTWSFIGYVSYVACPLLVL